MAETMSEKKSRILRLSQKELDALIASGDAKVLPKEEKGLEGLIEQESKAWSAFLGIEIPIPHPPKMLGEIWRKALFAEGIDCFEAHYLPDMYCADKTVWSAGGAFVTSFASKDFPGWKKIPSAFFWQELGKGNIEEDSVHLPGNWILIDRMPKPNYTYSPDGTQMYIGDPFKDLLIRLRKQGKLNQPDFFLEGSRYSISWNNVHRQVLPEIANLLDIPDESIRLPKAIEFNLIGNIFHPEWGETTTGEFFEDRYEKPWGNLIGGGSGSGGLRYVESLSSTQLLPNIGFRPLIVFPAS